MNNLIVEVNHTKELFCRFNMHRTARVRKYTLVFGILTAVAALLLIGADVIFGETVETGGAGVFFALCSMFCFIFSCFSSQRAVAKQVETNIETYPIRSKYTFSEDGFVVETDFSASRNTTEYKYSAIARVYLMDENTMYIMFKNNTYSLIQSEKCGSITALLSGKVIPQRFVRNY